MADNNLAPKPENDNEQSYGWQPDVFEGGDQGDGGPQGNLHAVEPELTPQPANSDPEKKFGVVDGGRQSTPQEQGRLKSVDGLENQGRVGKSFYTGSGGTSKQSIRTRIKAIVKKKKNFARGAIVAITIGGSLLGFTFLSGPLQFAHIAQLLSGFHFSTLENVTDDRASRLWRYARHHAISDADGTNPKRRYRRLGEVGNIFANGVEARLGDRGITAEYNTRSNFDGYTFDPNTYEGGRYRGDPDALRAHLESRGIAAEVNNGRVRAPAGRGFFSNRRLITTVATEAGYGKVLSKVSARVLRTRGAVFFHPIRRTDEAFKGAATEWWQRRRNRINNGDSGVEARTHNYNTEDDFNNRNSGDPDIKTTPVDVDVDGDTIERVRSSGGLTSNAIRTGGVATAAAAVTCVAYGISSNYDALADENVNKPLTRLGMEYTSLGGQVKSGEDFSIDQLGPYADPLYDEESGTSWLSAASVQHELGEPVTGPDIPDSARPSAENNAVSGFLSSIGGVSDFCKALGSPAGQLATLAMDVAAGPFSVALAGADIATNASGKALDFVTNWIARDPVDIERLAGAELGGALNYGVRLAANDQFIAQGGQELTATQTAQLDALNHSIEQSERSQIAFSDRLFNITDARSLVSKLSYSMPRSFDASVYYALNNVSLANLFSSPAKLLMPEAHAEDTYSYGFNEYGFSEDELNDPRIQNPYENFEVLTDQYDLSDLSDEYGEECFGVKVDDEGNVTQLEGGVNANSIPDDPCASDSEELFRFRFFLLDAGVANAGACYYGDEQACQAIGIGDSAGAGGTQQGSSDGQIIGDPNAPSANIPCAVGTKDLGTSTSAYSDGQEIPTRLCEITEFANIGDSGEPGYVTGSTGGVIVNSRVSGAWLALYEAAEADGVELIARSSFRTMEHQEEAWVDNGMNTALVARPGYSKHQTGHAIDFANVGGAKLGATCLTRNHQTDSEMWVWLEANARDYGFKVYSVEPWHWDALDAVNRC